MKAQWKNYSAIELEAMWLVWPLDWLAYYLKGCRHFDLWTDHLPLALGMNKDVRGLTENMQKFREAIQAHNVRITLVRGHIC